MGASLWKDKKIRFMISYELTSKTFITHVQRLQSQDLLLYGVLARNNKWKQIKREWSKINDSAKIELDEIKIGMWKRLEVNL